MNAPPKSMKDPLPIEAMQFANIVHELCGEACLAGSAPLAKYFYNLKHSAPQAVNTCGIQRILDNIDSNDIDIFAPFCPMRLAKQRSHDSFDRLTPREKHCYLRFSFVSEKNCVFGNFMLSDCGYLLWKRHRLQACDIKQRDFTEIGDWFENYNIWNDAAKVGIRKMCNFKLRRINGEALEANLQLILVDGHPKQGEEWHHFITSKFDIDIVKGIARIDRGDRLGELVFEEAVFDALREGRFSYTIRNCIDCKTILQRVNKCVDRGFVLASFGFDDSCSPDYRRHIMRDLHCHLGPRLCYKWFSSAGIDVGQTAAVIPSVVKYLKVPPHSPRMLRIMQVEALRSQFQDNDWYSPGCRKVHQVAFNRAIADERKTKYAALFIERWWIASRGSKSQTVVATTCRKRKFDNNHDARTSGSPRTETGSESRN